MENSISNQLFRERLKTLMKGISNNMVAKAIGVSHTTINNYLSGKSDPNPQIVKLLAEYFNVSVLFLSGLSDAKDYSHPKIAEICEYTGLTEDAVKTLREMKYLREVSSWYDEYKDYYDADSKYHRTTFPYLSALISLRCSDIDMDIIDSEIEQYCKASKALRTLEEKTAKLNREIEDLDNKILDYDKETGGLIKQYITQHKNIDIYRRMESGENIFGGYPFEERTLEEIEEDQKNIREKVAMELPDLNLEALCEKYTELNDFDLINGIKSEIMRQKTIKSRTLMDIIEHLNYISTVF